MTSKLDGGSFWTAVAWIWLSILVGFLAFLCWWEPLVLSIVLMILGMVGAFAMLFFTVFCVSRVTGRWME